MINKYINANLVKKFANILMNNLKLIFILFLVFFLFYIFYEYYVYQKEKKILKLSIMYNQAINNVNSAEFEEDINKIANDPGIYGVFASLRIIETFINNKDYNYAYEKYLLLLKNKETHNMYNSIIALHGSYNLIDNVNSDKINILLDFVDDAIVEFQGYKNEIQYLLSIKDNNLKVSQFLFEKIINNENISINIKERIKKINDFQKYK